jgi:acylphosphatase
MRVLTAAACLALAIALAGEKPTVDEKAKTVTVPGAFAKQGTYDVLKGAIEYVVVAKGGKEYEAILIVDCSPEELADAFAKIGLTPGAPSRENDPPRGKQVRILVEYGADGKKVKRTVDELVVSTKTNKPLEPFPWIYTGSTKGFDPAANKETLQVAMTKNLVGLHWADSSPFFQNPRAECREQNIYKPNVNEFPKPGTAALVIFERVMPKVPEGAKRLHVFVTGRVQGVGFRNFVEREARVLGVKGWVKNLPDGRVEAAIEGSAITVAALLEKVKSGPRSAKVENVDVKEEAPQGDFEQFEIRY